MKSLVSVFIITCMLIVNPSFASMNGFDCIELTIDNIKDIYEERHDVLISNPYIDDVCVGITFSQNDNGKFNDYYASIGISAEIVSKAQGDHQHVTHASIKGGGVFQFIVYVTDGKRADKVAGMFGETGKERLKREELMFYHEVSHLIKYSLSMYDNFESRELETMADISALYIYSHVNKLTKREFEAQANHLFLDRKSDSRTLGYSWYHAGIWVDFLRDIKKSRTPNVESFAHIYDYIYKIQEKVDKRPKDLLSMLSVVFTD